MVHRALLILWFQQVTACVFSFIGIELLYKKKCAVNLNFEQYSIAFQRILQFIVKPQF